MKTFWFIFIIFVPLGFLCGENPFYIYGRDYNGLVYFILDFFGLKALFNTPTMNQTWWYMETAIVLNILFPIIRKILKNNFATIILLCVTFVPIVYYSYFSNGNFDNCREIFWIFPFICGVLLSKYGLLNKFSIYLSENKAKAFIFSFIFVFIMTVLRSQFGIVVDSLYAISIILFIKAFVYIFRGFYGILVYFGNHSANIFMMHSFLYCYFVPIKQIIFAVPFAPLSYFLLLLESIVVSDYLEILKVRMKKVFRSNKYLSKNSSVKKSV